MEAKLGDKVVCRVNANGTPCEEENEISSEEGIIIGIDPEDENSPYMICFSAVSDFKGSCIVGNLHVRNYEVTPDYIGKYFYWGSPKFIKQILSNEKPNIQKVDGISCVHCTNFSHYASANLKDGGFLCYGCRQVEGWRYRDRL